MYLLIETSSVIFTLVSLANGYSYGHYGEYHQSTFPKTFQHNSDTDERTKFTLSARDIRASSDFGVGNGGNPISVNGPSSQFGTAYYQNSAPSNSNFGGAPAFGPSSSGGNIAVDGLASSNYGANPGYAPESSAANAGLGSLANPNGGYTNGFSSSGINFGNGGPFDQNGASNGNFYGTPGQTRALNQNIGNPGNTGNNNFGGNPLPNQNAYYNPNGGNSGIPGNTNQFTNGLNSGQTGGVNQGTGPNFPG